MREKIVELPEGVEVIKENDTITVKGPKGELRRTFQHPDITVEKKDSTIVISSGSERRKTKAIIGTWKAHLDNMVAGVSHGWETTLKIVYSHFPMKFNVKEDKVIVENFLGERKPRITTILPGTEVKNDKDMVTVTGVDKELVGQTAANIEIVTKVKGLDKRVFQDGIYVVEKPHPVEEKQ